MGTNEIWVVEHDCGDYYCEQNHIAAVATSEEECKRLYAEMLELKTTHRYHDGTERVVDAFPSYCLGMSGPYEIGKIVAEHSAVVTHEAPSALGKMLVRTGSGTRPLFRSPIATRALESFNAAGVPFTVLTGGDAA